MDYHSLYKSLLLKQFEPLLHKTLHRLNIFQGHWHYEDYLQELRLKLLTIDEAFDGKPLKGDGIRFAAYAGKGLYWHLVNLLRSENQQQEILVEDISLLSDTKGMLAPLQAGSYALSTFIEGVKQRLDKEELALFYVLADGSYSIHEIAASYGVSRKTIYERKKKLVEKIEELKVLLQ